MARIDRPKPYTPPTPPASPTPVTTPSTTTPASTTPVDAASLVVPPVPPGTPGMPTSDGFTLGGSLSTAGRNNLPDVLHVAPGGMKVVHGSDPGDFYCEHAFFITQSEARSPTSSVVKNAAGETLTGFLHVPPDVHTYRDPEPGIDVDTRHKNMRSVIGAALRGYYEQALPSVTGDVKILLTGYTTFHSVKNNPTGDFVSHVKNIDAALESAFGAQLLTKQGQVRPGASGDAVRLAYTIVDPQTGSRRELIIEARKLPVADEALAENDARSIPHAMRTFSPHAVLAMGVAGGPDFMAEFHADDGGLDLAGGARHAGYRQPTVSHPPNYSLARAIHVGSEGQRSNVRDLHIRSRLGGGPVS
jgi:pyrrolidone-carboxylate peptidase